ncbi:MAG: PQQ-dependent sugar dehydrogenase [Chitinophagaceae bacterium]|nr:PQQ-dependent sugar dehydrogenase [Chitinophagaceae bacterium]
MKTVNFLLAFVVSIVSLTGLWSCKTDTPGDPYSSDSLVLQNGQGLFGKHCSSCHNFYHDDIAPQLANITAHQTFGWIKSFISNPDQVIKSGDTTAAKLFAEYKTTMPPFSFLPEADLTSIISYIHSQRQPVQVPDVPDTTDLKNPIPDTIENSNITVEVTQFSQVPKSSEDVPLTRIIKLDFIPNSGDLYVLDLRGKLYKLTNGEPQVYMDITKLRPRFMHEPGMATGFGSFAFHPDFQSNGLFYTTHAESVGSGQPDFAYDSIIVTLQWVLTEWKTTPGAFPFNGSGREILRINMPTSIHGMQEIAFNRTAKKGDSEYGLLYVCVGDGGCTSIGKRVVSEVPNKIWGSILRIDPLGKNSSNGQYGIPANNPFVDSHDGKLAKEVYAYGFRNPHRLSWSKKGQLFAVNIGERSIESVNLIEPGHFYGWPLREGTFSERFFNGTGRTFPLPANDSIYHVTYPVAQFDHGEGTAICGGFEYTGSLIDELKGKFVFGDIGTGKLFYVSMSDLKQGHQAKIRKWNLSQNGSPTSLAKLCGNSRVDMRYGVDDKGELYILTKADGRIYKLVNRVK